MSSNLTIRPRDAIASRGNEVLGKCVRQLVWVRGKGKRRETRREMANAKGAKGKKDGLWLASRLLPEASLVQPTYFLIVHRPPFTKGNPTGLTPGRYREVNNKLFGFTPSDGTGKHKPYQPNCSRSQRNLFVCGEVLHSFHREVRRDRRVTSETPYNGERSRQYQRDGEYWFEEPYHGNSYVIPKKQDSIARDQPLQGKIAFGASTYHTLHNLVRECKEALGDKPGRSGLTPKEADVTIDASNSQDIVDDHVRLQNRILRALPHKSEGVEGANYHLQGVNALQRELRNLTPTYQVQYIDLVDCKEEQEKESEYRLRFKEHGNKNVIPEVYPEEYDRYYRIGKWHRRQFLREYLPFVGATNNFYRNQFPVDLDRSEKGRWDPGFIPLYDVIHPTWSELAVAGVGFTADLKPLAYGAEEGGFFTTKDSKGPKEQAYHFDKVGVQLRSRRNHCCADDWGQYSFQLVVPEHDEARDWIRIDLGYSHPRRVPLPNNREFVFGPNAFGDGPAKWKLGCATVQDVFASSKGKPLRRAAEYVKQIRQRRKLSPYKIRGLYYLGEEKTPRKGGKGAK